MAWCILMRAIEHRGGNYRGRMSGILVRNEYSDFRSNSIASDYKSIAAFLFTLSDSC